MPIADAKAFHRSLGEAIKEYDEKLEAKTPTRD
jgi:hypothetical protein